MHNEVPVSFMTSSQPKEVVAFSINNLRFMVNPGRILSTVILGVNTPSGLAITPVPQKKPQKKGKDVQIEDN